MTASMMATSTAMMMMIILLQTKELLKGLGGMSNAWGWPHRGVAVSAMCFNMWRMHEVNLKHVLTHEVKGLMMVVVKFGS